MKAYSINRYSKVDKLQLTEVPQPIAAENEVLIQIHSASINQLDAKLKSGEFKLLLPYKFPLVLGHDVAGTIVGVGSKVSHLQGWR
jgi:NADPH:quinone reductase-like Zn-dependent oxidoreductase